MQAQSIDDVLCNLAEIVADTKARGDPLGYFPALYRQVTLEVKSGIAGGIFDDGPRMSRFDALFANAYFTAYGKYRNHQQPSGAWQLAFDEARSGRLIILQNLVLAINAHINLDLGVVTANAFQGAEFSAFHHDFDQINAILASLIPLARNTINQFSPLLGDLSEVGGPDVALALEFSTTAARDEAWRAATLISLTPAELEPLLVDTVDARTKLLGRVVADPPEPAGSVVRQIQRAESTDVAAIISALDALV